MGQGPKRLGPLLSESLDDGAEIGGPLVGPVASDLRRDVCASYEEPSSWFFVRSFSWNS